MAWIFEPSQDCGRRRCGNDAVQLAGGRNHRRGFEGDAGDAEPEYVGDVPPDAFRSLLASAKA